MDNQKKKKSQQGILPKQAKNQSSVTAQSLIGNMNTSTNLFSQFSAQYLGQKQSDTINETTTLGSKVSDYLQKQEDKQPDFFHSFDADTQKILHGLNKKNETTKLRSLGELRVMLLTKDAAYFEEFTPTFVNIYKQFASSEHERKVLEEANNVLYVICQHGKKSMQSKFKELFPLWFLLMNDQNQDVSRTALAAFEVAFPKEKWGNAVQLCQDGYLNNLRYYLKITPKTVEQENQFLSEGQGEYIYERLILGKTSAVRSITTALKWTTSNKDDQRDSFCADVMTLLHFRDAKKSAPLLMDILEQNKSRPRVVSSILDCIDQLLAMSHVKQFVVDNIEVIAQKTLFLYPHVFRQQNRIDDRERIIQQSLWRGFLPSLLSNSPSSVLIKLDQSQLEQRVLAVVKSSAFGVGRPFYEQLIIVLAYLPQASIKEYRLYMSGSLPKDPKQREEAFKVKLSFMKRFMDCVMSGTLHEEARFFSEYIINCYFECLYFIIVKRMQPVLLEQDHGAWPQAKNIIRDLIKSPLAQFLKGDVTPVYNFIPFKQFPASLANFYQMMTSKIVVGQQMRSILGLPLQELKSNIYEMFQTDDVSFSNLLVMFEQFCVKVSNQSLLFDEIIDLIASSGALCAEHITLILKASETINDMPLMSRLVRNLASFYGIINKHKEMPLLSGCASLMHQDKINELLRLLYTNLFNTININNNAAQVIELCHQAELLRRSLDQLNVFLHKTRLQDAYLMQIMDGCLGGGQTVQASQQGIFKLKWVCMHMIADELASATYYQEVVGARNDINQEWSLVETHSNRNPVRRVESALQSRLIGASLGIQNMSYRIYLPSMINMIDAVLVDEVLVKYADVSGKVLSMDVKMRPYFGVYEELFYLMNHLVAKGVDADVALVYAHTFDVMWLQVASQQSQKNNRLLRIINLFGDVAIIQTQQVTQALRTVEQLLQKLQTNKADTIIKYLNVLWESFKYHPLFSLYKKGLCGILLDKRLYDLVDGGVYRVLQAVALKDPDNLKNSLLERMHSDPQLISVLLASTYSFSVLYDHKLKRFLQNFVHNTLKPIILDHFEAQDDQILVLLQTLLSSAQTHSRLYALALRQLIRQFFIEEKHNHPHYSSLLMTKIMTQFIIQPLKAAIHTPTTNLMDFFIIRQLLPLIDTKNEFLNGLVDVDVSALIAMMATSRDQDFLIKLDVTTILLTKCTTLSDLEDEHLLANVIEQLFAITEFSNYRALVTFEFVNLVTERKTITPFAGHIAQLSSLYAAVFQQNTQAPKNYYSFAIISGLTFLRKILGFIEAFPPEFKDFVNFSLHDSCLSFIKFCDSVGTAQDIGANASLLEEQNEQMFVEYAETMLRFHQLFEIQDEAQYYELLKCQLISIQKAAFLGLRSFYAGKQQHGQQLVEILQLVDYQEEERQLVRQARKMDEEEAEHFDADQHEIIKLPLSSSQMAYFLSWLLITNPKAKDHQLLQQTTAYQQQYLNNLTYLLEFLQDNGVQFDHDSKDIYNGEFDLASVQDDQSQLLKLVIIGLYQFIAVQQGQFKQWVEQQNDKHNIRDIENVVKLYISRSIFDREIEIIETKQNEWSSEEFQIYVTRSIREITASYTKEGQKIEISIHVPLEFPLKPLKIDVKKGVKVGEAKINRWSLMIRMLLQNENDSILNGLMIWKLNLDKQFEGLEECAVCYYVIHSTGELPKMSCRTCKHKFHSFCIQKWFQTSNKSECPLCKSQFL